MKPSREKNGRIGRYPRKIGRITLVVTAALFLCCQPQSCGNADNAKKESAPIVATGGDKIKKETPSGATAEAEKAKIETAPTATKNTSENKKQTAPSVAQKIKKKRSHAV